MPFAFNWSKTVLSVEHTSVFILEIEVLCNFFEFSDVVGFIEKAFGIDIEPIHWEDIWITMLLRLMWSLSNNWSVIDFGDKHDAIGLFDSYSRSIELLFTSSFIYSFIHRSVWLLFLRLLSWCFLLSLGFFIAFCGSSEIEEYIVSMFGPCALVFLFAGIEF